MEDTGKNKKTMQKCLENTRKKARGKRKKQKIRNLVIQ